MDNAASYSASDLTKLFDDDEIKEYASYEQDFFRADGSLYFMPSSGYLYCGYVSNEKSNANGVFTNVPAITVIWNAAWTWYNMALTFGGAVPTKMTISLYNDNILEDSFVVDEAIDTNTLIE